MSIKTPEEIAADALSVDTETFFGRSITDWIVAAVKADRQQVIDAIRDCEWYDDDNDPIIYTNPIVEELEVGL